MTVFPRPVGLAGLVPPGVERLPAERAAEVRAVWEQVGEG